MSDRRRVVVVTGGGAGIGAAIAESAAGTGAFVVTVDPLVTVDGSERLPQPQESTADRINASGGAARASAVSVTDEAALRNLFHELTEEFGGLDAVVNAAGISRPTGFTAGDGDDWRSVLSVHLDGYRNVLNAALPLMAAAGRGHILGVTSGSGWRAADGGAYGSAKRAVAALTWQLGRHAPAGVVVNAISPIAATRMVAAALGGRMSNTASGGLSLGAMPAPEHLGPLGAHLIDDGFTSCQGRVIFLGGAEAAVIDEPRLVEVVRSDALISLPHLFDVATTAALGPAEARQTSGGGANSRFGSIFDEDPADGLPVSGVHCAVVTDRSGAADAVATALRAWGATSYPVHDPAALTDLDALDAVVVALSSRAAEGVKGPSWQRILAEHADTVDEIYTDARWVRVVAQLAQSRNTPVRVVIITEATTAGGRTRAQAAAQFARAGRKATGDLVTPFAISAESEAVPAELAAYLVCGSTAEQLAGAELVTGAGWFGLRSHPRPLGSINFGGPSVPSWFDDLLREVVRPG